MRKWTRIHEKHKKLTWFKMKIDTKWSYKQQSVYVQTRCKAGHTPHSDRMTCDRQRNRPDGQTDRQHYTTRDVKLDSQTSQWLMWSLHSFTSLLIIGRSSLFLTWTTTTNLYFISPPPICYDSITQRWLYMHMALFTLPCMVGTWTEFQLVYAIISHKRT